jgi:hypothetical protein
MLSFEKRSPVSWKARGLHVSHDPRDAPTRPVARSENPPADGILAGEIPARQRLTDDHHRVGPIRIAVEQGAPAQPRNSDDFEVWTCTEGSRDSNPLVCATVRPSMRMRLPES